MHSTRIQFRRTLACAFLLAITAFASAQSDPTIFTFGADSTLTVKGVFGGTPASGNLNLSNLVVELPATVSGGGSSFQPLNSNLTAISSLVTTSFGRDLITYANASAVRQAIAAQRQAVYNVKDYGAVGDDSTDDTASINLALAAVATAGKGALYLPAGTYRVNSTLYVDTDKIRIYGDGAASVLKAKPNTDFEYVLSATGRTGITLMDFVVDANASNRLGVLTGRTCGIQLDDCNDATLINVTAKHALGWPGLSAVGFGIAGGSRTKIIGCTAIDNGDSEANKNSDGFFTLGTQTVSIGSVATRCSDTGTVIENSQQSGLIGFTAKSCGAGAAIVNVSNSVSRGNFINGITIEDWIATQPGAIQIGNPASYTTGDLVDTVVSNVMIRNITGTGPSLRVRREGAAKTVRLTISNFIVDGAGTQGLLVNAEDVTISNGYVSADGNGIDLQTGSARVKITNVHVVSPLIGIGIATGCDALEIGDCRITGNGSTTSHGVYAYGTSTNVRVRPTNDITGVVIAKIGADNGTSPYSIDDVIVASTQPTSGLWKLGQTLRAETPAIGDPLGWVVTTGGLATGTAVFTPIGYAVTGKTGTGATVLATSPTITTPIISGGLDVTGNVRAGGLLGSSTFTPSASVSTGTTGNFSWDTNYFYICVATDLWKRIPLSGW